MSAENLSPIDSELNGAYLSKVFHRPMHTHAYMGEVSRLLSTANGRDDVIWVLNHVRAELQAGRVPGVTRRPHVGGV